jgi:hypothetical protein
MDQLVYPILFIIGLVAGYLVGWRDGSRETHRAWDEASEQWRALR